MRVVVHSSRRSKFAAAALLLGCNPHVQAFVPSVSLAKRTSSSVGRSTISPPLYETVARETAEDGARTEAAAQEEAPTAPVQPINLLPPEYLAARQKAMAGLHLSGKLPAHMEEPLSHFMTEYFVACSSTSTPETIAANFLKAIELGVKYGMGSDRYTFTTSHRAFIGGEEDNPEGDFDFYEFGCGFFRPAMDFQNSVVLGEENMAQAVEQLKNGENVVFLANHQSEADPQVVSCLMESIGFDALASDVTYVAGHKVTTDPLAIPFSMGRNLLCIHSKKHINSEPDLKSMKSQQNLQTMGSMLGLLRQGGAALWVAPSGGRDRRDIDSGEVPVAPFDQKTIDMFRLMGNKSKVKTHFYTMALVSYDLCPPPDVVEAGVGEQRNVRFVPVGMAIGEEVPNVGGVEKRHLFTEHALEECERSYEQLLEKMDRKLKGDEEAAPSTPSL